MDNKGFAVSSVLYAILICFLMFLGAAMAMFSSSNSLVVSANDDIINGTQLKATRVIASNSVCSGSTFSLENFNNTSKGNKILIKISSRYGTKYWPKDFLGTNSSGKLSVNIEGTQNVNNNFGQTLTITDTITSDSVSIAIKNPCQ